jgi:hypothetical protein
MKVPSSQWTPEERLAMIAAILEQNFNPFIKEDIFKIEVLAKYDSRFIELNRSSFTNGIKFED